MDLVSRMVHALNTERQLQGLPSLSNQEVEQVKGFYQDKFKELKATSAYEQLPDKDKLGLHDVVFGRFNENQNRPTCSINSNVKGASAMNDKEQINRFRGLGYDHIIDKGLGEGLSVGDIAINILGAIPANRYIEQQQAIDLLVEAGRKISNNSGGSVNQEKPSNVSEQQQAVDLLVNAVAPLSA